MIDSLKVDLRELSRLTNGLQNALIGTGEDGDAKMIVKDESGLLAAECMKQVGPKDRKKSADRIRSQIGKRFLAADHDVDVGSGAIIGKNVSGRTGEIEWIAASSRFLFGVLPDHDLRHADPENLVKIFQKLTKSGAVKVNFRHARKQQIFLLAKILTSAGGRKKAAAIIIGHLGRMKASFASTVLKLKTNASIPQWISKHLPSPKTVYIATLSNPARASITFGSRSRGVTDHEKEIARAVQVRVKKTALRLVHTLEFYAHEHKKTGHVHRKGK
jgi:hypothetical protein